MRLPAPTGSLSAGLIDALRDGDVDTVPPGVGVHVVDPLSDDDLQLALWICYELHYRGFDGVPAQWEWEPAVLGLRRELEDRVLAALRAQVVVPRDDRAVPDRLVAAVDADDGPSLSRHLLRSADSRQLFEFICHRSIYQLKEADPHSWALPRLHGRAKAALVEIQMDEYGNGDLRQMHAELFAVTLRELELDDSYGAYVDDVPGITLAISNVMSMFGLRRELRGALVGHLAAYEMTSSAPCRRYAKALRRHGASDAACAFYDVHVSADALHEQLAAHDLCGGLADSEPELTEDIIFGALACLHVDGQFARHLLECWDAGSSSLRTPVADLASAS